MSQKHSSAKTSIRGNEVAALVKLFDAGFFVSGGTALDYGAGKYGRNANYLRSNGVQTYAYDKYNGTSSNGWDGVSLVEPEGQFDVSFTCYVLNVVPVDIESDIIKAVENSSERVFHITRGSDITNMVYNVISGRRKNMLMMQYIETEYTELFAQITETNDLKAIAREIASRGVVTAKDCFQRIPDLTKYGYKRSGAASSVVWTK